MLEERLTTHYSLFYSTYYSLLHVYLVLGVWGLLEKRLAHEEAVLAPTRRDGATLDVYLRNLIDEV